MQGDNPGADEVGRGYDVFLSYAHLDAEHDVANAQQLARWLDSLGYDVWWDRALVAGQKWPKTLSAKVRASKRVVVLWSPRAARSDWVKFETNLATTEDITLVPIIIEPEPVPGHWGEIHRVKLSDLEAQKAEILRVLAIEPSRTPGTGIRQADLARVTIPPELAPGDTLLIGRDIEQSMLAKAWASTAPTADPAHKTNVVVFHAIGGAGKTALLRTFINDLASGGFDGAFRVYGWSAYSQGSGDNRNADADGFITAALGAFGHDLKTQPITDATERGKRLAKLVGERRTLLILDGLEPLQDLPVVNRGRLKDPGMRALITALALDSRGLVLITSRQELPELTRHARPRVVNHPLDRMNMAESVALLEHLGVTGRRTELAAAADDVMGHALSLNLLGTYLDTVHGGDVTHRDQFRFGDIIDPATDLNLNGDDTARYARRAARIMEGYVARFEDLAGASKGQGAPEAAILAMAGLFDRPADAGALTVLRAGPPISGLTDAFAGLSRAQSDARWRVALDRLRKLKLLSAEDPRAKGGLDAHPIVRAHFGERLRQQAPDAFTEANRRLYQHYAAQPEKLWGKRLPDTLDEMQPLFHAIAHGCAAGLHQEVFDDVYWARVLRGNEAYITSKLGGYSANLGTLAHFFDPPWSQPHPALSLPDQAMALNFAGFALRALGRLRDAVEPFSAHVQATDNRKNWPQAAAAASNLSELLLTLGDVGPAVAAARDGVTYADRTDDLSWHMVNRTTLADALHQSGDTAEAATLFAESERLQAEVQPTLPRLYSLQGYQLCDLLLARAVPT